MAVTMTRDARGAEQRTETGVGRITKVEPKGERNAQVTIDASHLREEVKGWVDRQGPVWPRVQQAHAEGRDVWYRVDVHRKASVAVDLPLADVERRDKVRDLVGIERPEDAPSAPAAAAPGASQPAGGPAGPAAPSGPAAARTAPRSELTHGERDEVDAARGAAYQEIANYLMEDRVEPVQLLGLLRRHHPVLLWGGLQKVLHSVGSPFELLAPDAEHPEPWLRRIGNAPTRHTAGAPARDAASEALARQRDPDAVAERAPAARAIAEPASSSGRDVSPTSGLSRQRLAVASDGRPWDMTNTDGRPNLASYAAGAVMEVTNLAGRLLITRARQRHEEAVNAGQPSSLRAPGEQALADLARTLLRCADSIQVGARGGRVDRMSASHRLARQALREGLDLYPVPWGAAPADVEAWQRDVIAHGVLLVSVGVSLLEDVRGELRATTEITGQPAEA